MASFCVGLFALALLVSFSNLVQCIVTPQQNSPAIFVFGDSLFDAGNNNFIRTTNDFKANFPPYGETAFFIPTGRFSDGYLIPDYIASFARKPLVLPYLAIQNGPFTNGVNFASAGAGSLDGTNTGLVISLKGQVANFKKVAQQLKQQLGSERSKQFLSNAVYMFSFGSNDYSTFITNSTLLNSYTPNQYVDMVVGNMSTSFQEIYKEGGRKFVVLSVGAIGCVPSARAATNNGDCLEILQTLSKTNNDVLQKTLVNLANTLQGFKYSFFRYLVSALETINNPTQNGFTEVKTACCGSGPFRGDSSCGGRRGMTSFELCPDVENYLFWDFNHPSAKANLLSATLMWNQSTFVSPNTVNSFFQL